MQVCLVWLTQYCTSLYFHSKSSFYGYTGLSFNNIRCTVNTVNSDSYDYAGHIVCLLKGELMMLVLAKCALSQLDMQSLL